MFLLFFFFFSSRRRHTRLTCDWSSDVCSSDLTTSFASATPRVIGRFGAAPFAVPSLRGRSRSSSRSASCPSGSRSEERRVGKECRYRWAPDDVKKKNDRDKEVSDVVNSEGVVV